nr:DUF1850 domain-containing protein [Phytoactinopolyspora mesophila]
MRLAGSGELRLEIYDHGAETVAFSRPVAPGEGFDLEHTHSVTKRLVVESFSIDEAPQILLDELWFDEFGPNLPAGAEESGDRTTTFLHEDGAYRVLHHGFPIGTVPVRVGSEAVDHVLVFSDGDRVRLLDVARAGEYVELAVHER